MQTCVSWTSALLEVNIQDHHNEHIAFICSIFLLFLLLTDISRSTKGEKLKYEVKMYTVDLKGGSGQVRFIRSPSIGSTVED
jgi:hypothetical protein